MPYFCDTNELASVMEELWATIADAPDVAEPLIESRLVVRFHYRDPEGRLTVDCSDGKLMKVLWGECDTKPVVEMFMKSDVAHQFWLGKVNVPVYLLSGKIVAKGPVNKALALLPAIKPAFELYPEVIRRVLNRSLAAAGNKPHPDEANN
ncbi:MAG: SCP2 sterol-binding domain-containing protein [Candidatus Melainabacteria bacterium]|nr:SCP2 sterol-binding domain-containing protein [Candidatus Melainabacteria bacterium]